MTENEIYDSMMELGKKFSEIAKKAESAKSARSSFDLAERAYKLALLAKKKESAPANYNYAFLSKLDCVMKRSQVWLDYEEFCQCYDLIPVTKGSFFNALQRVGFVFKKDKFGDVCVHPPKTTPKILQEAVSLLE